MLTHLSLFSGIGGLDLAAEAAGFQTVGQCEYADYPTKVLEKHWPDVPRWRDIRTLTGESFYERTGLHTATVISGGFPCQPFSFAGKRRGKDDDRYLWPEMLRVISEIQPTWVIGENVAGIVNMALDQVLSDLEGIDYTTQAFIIPACGVDAPHRRNRVAIIGFSNTNSSRCIQWQSEIEATERRSKCGENVANTRRKYGERDTSGMETNKAEWTTSNLSLKPSSKGYGGQWSTESGMGGMVDGLPGWMAGMWDREPDIPRIAKGIPNRVNKLKALGNAVVPAQFYPFFKAIVEIELHKGVKHHE